MPGEDGDEQHRGAGCPEAGGEAVGLGEGGADDSYRLKDRDLGRVPRWSTEEP
jgi:hypothetical protein